MNSQNDSDLATIPSSADARTAEIDFSGQDDADYGYGRTAALDFAAIWAAIYRSRLWILGILVACLLAGIVISLLSTPIYRATSTVQIDQEAAKVIGTEETDLSASIQDSDRFLQTQLDIIRSRALATSVAEDENLFGNKAFLEAMGVDPDVESEGALSKEETERELVLETLRENFSVSLPIDSRVTSMVFESPDPKLAARIANSYAENYIRNNLQRKFDTSSYAREFLKEQLDAAAARLGESERKALAYARSTRIIDASNAAQTEDGRAAPRSLTAATLVQLNQEYAAAFARRIEAQKKWETARGTATLNTPQVLNNLAVQNLVQERAKLEAELEDQLQRRKDDYPTVRQLTARKQELDRQIAAISSGIRNSIRGEYETALAQEKALQKQINVLKESTLDEQSNAVQLSILQRESDTNRQLYDLLLTRYNELNAESGVQSNNVINVDRAIVPVDPISPNIPLNLGLSLLTGIALAGAFVFGREQIFDTIRTPDDISNKLGRLTLGTIPVLKSGADMSTEMLDQKSNISEAYTSVRTSLMLASSHGLPNSIMFTSARQGEGKSSSCFATALALSRINKKVAVIDLDLRRPSQHKFFGLQNVHGMSDLLSQNAKISDVIQKTKYSNISFISSGAIPPNPAELLAGENARSVLKQLEDEFDIVLVDSAPLLGLADAVVVGSMVESCVFVVEANRNQTSLVRTAVNRLLQSGAKLTGILLSKFDAKQSGYSYEYQYQYEYDATSSSK